MTDEADPPGNRAYRAKLLSPEGGIVTTVSIMASTLPEALDQVRGLTSSYEVEIWEHGDMVQRLPHRPRR